MKKLFLVYLVIVTTIVLFLASGCKKDEPARIPDVSTAPVSNITTEAATSGGAIEDDGGASIAENGVCWGLTENPTINDSKTIDGVSTGQFVSNLAGLDPGTNYHLRAYATNAVGTSYGDNMTFLTLGQAPSGQAQTPTNITAAGATLNGTVNPNDLSTTVTFEYGTTTSYGSTEPATQSPVTGNAMVNVSAEISGLLPGTTYHYRVKTVNSIGTTYSEDKTFTTLGQAPTATTQAACCLSTTGATLNGIVNANYASTVVTFEYGTTTSYGQTVTATQSPVTGTTNNNVSANITELTAGTTYHFRVKAVNSMGTTYGNDKSFTTLYSPPPTSGLVGYWPFSGNANDASGNGHNGTVNGAILTTDRYSTNNSAYSFNGVDNFINLGNLGAYSSHTFTGWFKIEQWDGWGVLVSKLYNDMYIFQNSEVRINADSNNGNIMSIQFGSGITWVGPVIVDNPIDSDNWHHFVLMYDNNAKEIKVYIDNVLIATEIVTGYSDVATTPTYIGARPYWNGPTTFFFNGNIDDVRIYNRSLNTEEVNALYHEGGW